MDKPGPRERLLVAARELTYREGMSVGVDAILSAAGVSRRSLYHHVGSKDGLIAEMLRGAAEDEERQLRAALDAGGDDPRQRIVALFDAFDEATSSPDFHGCRFTTAELSLADPGHPAHAKADAHKEQIHRLLKRELERLAHPDPSLGANQLQLLVEGVLVMAAIRPGCRPVRAVRAMVDRVLEAGG